MSNLYQHIPGLGPWWGRVEIASLSGIYCGPDHLLIVLSNGYAEEYRRIFFRDIRYVEVRHTNSQTWQAFISMIVCFLIALLFFVPLAWWLVTIFCFPFALWFVINLVRGSSCECYIATNVQILKIPTPTRVRKVNALIAFLRDQTAALATPAPPQPAAES